MKSIVIAFLLFLGALGSCMADGDSWSITSGDKAFFEQIKKAILADDFDAFAGAVAYPTELHFLDAHRLEPRNVPIQTKSELKKYKSAIFSDGLKSAIRIQSADSMSKSWRGLMVANGDLWFDQIQCEGQTNWTYRIVAINITIQK